MTPRWSGEQRAMLGALGLNWWPGLRAEPRATPPAPVLAPAVAPKGVGSLPPAPTPASIRPVPVAEALRPALPVAPAAPAVPVAGAVAVDLRAVDAPALAQRVRDCRACGLCEQRRQALPGEGQLQAHWMVVGEVPGEAEDEQGQPFVGPSGEMLDAMLAALDLRRSADTPARQVFVTHAVKCRPPRNRNPQPEEIAACRPYLLRQIELVRPRLLLALGRTAVQSLLGSDEPLGRLRGRVHAGPHGVPVVVSYHPAYLLRNPLDKARAWEDLCLAADTVEAAP
ncbi:DNA polymerase [Inhella inkyongensis]|uniref:Type-4 uracil-DNA glycosylase n=1 Tax=Inhella inkyongensis TaxID=392593 RepID=A0A840S1Y3_9BURK|nr:uracil-DNA glycosylase [Inhella inkyongensis]MBB5203096.1 DNA polymerase [Inhella inkyongensis]